MCSIEKSLENTLCLIGGLTLSILIFLILNKNLLAPAENFLHFVWCPFPQTKVITPTTAALLRTK